MAQEIVQETGKDVGKFIGDFAAVYIAELINAKIMGAIEEAISEIMPDVAAGEDEEEPGANEEKTIEDKEDAAPPIAAGAILCGVKSGWGPDRIYHKYYDMATFAIRAEDSVIAKKTYRHRTLLNFYGSLKKESPEAGSLPFPKKKLMGKKDSDYYRGRFKGMDTYFKGILAKQDICKLDSYLIFFGLKFDADAADRRELFFAALESACEKENINWSYAYRRAQRLGLDEDEVEMLKIVAIEKVGRKASAAIRSEIHSKAPDFVPASVKNKFVSKVDGKLAGVIGTTVETGWNGAKEGFAKVTDGLNEAMDKATGPIKEMFTKVMTPVKELIDSKIQKPESKEDPLDEKLQGLGVDRFAPVADALGELQSGGAKAEKVANDIMNAVCKLNYTHHYTPYIQYNCGDPDILEWFPPIENIAEKHQRLTVALIDVAYVLGRGMVRAFMPLAKYVDKCHDNFDAGGHDAAVQAAVLEGGQKLAIDYFSLPSTTWWATWWCGNRITTSVLTFCRETVNKQADVLGSVATNWKPTSSADARETFGKAVRDALDAFLMDRMWTIVKLIRDSAARMISNLFLSVVGDAIEKIAEVLNDLVSKLPPPLSDLKPGDIVSGLLEGLVEKIAMFAVLKWARKPECFLAGEGEPEPWDEALAKKFRVTPRIRNDDDDFGEEEPDEEEADGGDDGDGDGKERKGSGDEAEATEG